MIGGFFAGPMVGDEYGVRPDGFYYLRGHLNLAAAGADTHSVAIGDAETFCEVRVYFTKRLGVLVDQHANAAGLGAAEVL